MEQTQELNARLDKLESMMNNMVNNFDKLELETTINLKDNPEVEVSNDWEITKENLLENLGGNLQNSRAIVNRILDNTKKYIDETAMMGDRNVKTLSDIIFPVTVKVISNLMTNEFVGIQPMDSPVSQIHTMNRFTKDDSSKSSLAIAIQKQTVEAKTRTLSAKLAYSLPSDDDEEVSTTVSDVMITALADEITAEIDNDILRELYTIANTKITHVYDEVFNINESTMLAMSIYSVAKLIGLTPNKYKGNYAVLPSNVFDTLKSNKEFFVSAVSSNSKSVGKLVINDHEIKLYVNDVKDDQILIGYKGTTETDAPAFYCPYVPVMSGGMVLDPATFEPTLKFISRYGYVELRNSSSRDSSSKNYLGKIQLLK